MSTATATPSVKDVKDALKKGRTPNAKGVKPKKLTEIAQQLGMKYNSVFVPFLHKHCKDTFVELGEELPKQLGGKKGEKRVASDLLKKVDYKKLILAVFEGSQKGMTFAEVAKSLNMRKDAFKAQYDTLKEEMADLPELSDKGLTKETLTELQVYLNSLKQPKEETAEAEA